MSREVVCPVCDSDIPLDEDAKAGDDVYCDSCKTELKLVKKRVGSEDQLTADYDEEY